MLYIQGHTPPLTYVFQAHKWAPTLPWGSHHERIEAGVDFASNPVTSLVPFCFWLRHKMTAVVYSQFCQGYIYKVQVEIQVYNFMFNVEHISQNIVWIRIDTHIHSHSAPRHQPCLTPVEPTSNLSSYVHIHSAWSSSTYIPRLIISSVLLDGTYRCVYTQWIVK